MFAWLRRSTLCTLCAFSVAACGLDLPIGKQYYIRIAEDLSSFLRQQVGVDEIRYTIFSENSIVAHEDLAYAEHFFGRVPNTRMTKIQDANIIIVAESDEQPSTLPGRINLLVSVYLFTGPSISSSLIPIRTRTVTFSCNPEIQNSSNGSCRIIGGIAFARALQRLAAEI